MTPQQINMLGGYLVLTLILGPIACVVMYWRWQQRRALRVIERRQAALFAEEQAWADAIKRGDHLAVPPVVMRIYPTSAEYVQDLAQMKALAFEVQDQILYDDGGREVTYYFVPVYGGKSNRGVASE